MTAETMTLRTAEGFVCNLAMLVENLLLRTGYVVLGSGDSSCYQGLTKLDADSG